MQDCMVYIAIVCTVFTIYFDLHNVQIYVGYDLLSSTLQQSRKQTQSGISFSFQRISCIFVDQTKSQKGIYFAFCDHCKNYLLKESYSNTRHSNPKTWFSDITIS